MGMRATLSCAAAATEPTSEAPPAPQLEKIWADAAYRGRELAEWRLRQGSGWNLEVAEREPVTRSLASEW